MVHNERTLLSLLPADRSQLAHVLLTGPQLLYVLLVPLIGASTPWYHASLLRHYFFRPCSA